SPDNAGSRFGVGRVAEGPEETGAAVRVAARRLRHHDREADHGDRDVTKSRNVLQRSGAVWGPTLLSPRHRRFLSPRQNGAFTRHCRFGMMYPSSSLARPMIILCCFAMP